LQKAKKHKKAQSQTMIIDTGHIILGVGTLLSALGNIFLWRKTFAESKKITVEANSVEVKSVQDALHEWRELYDSIKAENLAQNVRHDKAIKSLQREVTHMENALSAIHRLADIFLKEIAKHNPKRSSELREEYQKVIKELKIA
jgi:ASC-1-like (ASCH) protein